MRVKNSDLDSTTIWWREDYGVVYTISGDDYSKIKEQPNLTVIGHMTAPSKAFT